MDTLFFDAFTEESDLVLPYQKVGQDVALAYERNGPGSGTMATVRKLFDADNVQFLAVDCLNFADKWFGLEIDLGNKFQSVEVELKTYPGLQVYPKVYFEGGSLDLNTIQSGELRHKIKFTMDHFRGSGLPEGAKNPRLALMLPCSEWFVVGLYRVKVSNA